ncbi:DUF3006 domain-containing protein [Candidatus Contubernalis alkaliaceticus]|uniref:DUF3006 domain-containing protein n=1 Tax=Candidatus Contubernalis alkaliaceticus TaxID=338645 RepID=UPI001F4C457A|nr:DUF3006 domain-containing protein [Candidatus Contubernalis alkalaceticus]UNC91976.1 DUF3006 domain-containing protein [Candidatus Contubernalis alkalaceticus]
MKAVIDRIESNYAVVLMGDEEIKINIPLDFLPKNAPEGSWLKITFELDAEETKKQEKKISDLIEKLKNKNN